MNENFYSSPKKKKAKRLLKNGLIEIKRMGKKKQR